jgi:hypothetical protein
MNIKFEINKLETNKYRLKVLDYDEKFITFISKKSIVHISFDKKLINIVKSCEWKDCDVSNDRFSYYVSTSWINNLHDNTSICSEEFSRSSYHHRNSKRYIVMCFNKHEQIINTDIEDFDKIFIKAIKVLSDTYNNVKY